MLLQHLVQFASFFYTCIVWFISICTHISRYNVINYPTELAWICVTSGLLNILFCSWMLKKQRYKCPLMELEAGGRLISDAFLRVQFPNFSSSKVVHFVLGETTLTKYRIFSNKRPRRLLNFETVRCGAYQRAVLIRGTSLFQS